MHHILVVEDDPIVSETLQTSLEDFDGTFRVTRAANVNEALCVLGEDPPDAALIDAVLPDGSGLDLAQTVIKLGVPVLLTSGYPDVGIKLAEAGWAFLPKPFGATALVTELQALIETARRRRAQLAIGLDRLAKNINDLAEATEEAKRARDARLIAKRAQEEDG
jgi:two-component system, OmpR family, KDP operon response regulator KdpE